MEQMQFCAIILLTLLTLKLLLLQRKVGVTPIVSTARWLMTVGIALLGVQFLLQYILGLRAMGVTQAVLLNLVLFIPSSWCISIALQYLQQQGRLTLLNKWAGGLTWATSLILLGIAASIDGQPLFSDTPELHKAEVTSSFLYLAMQTYYSYYHVNNLRSMRRKLQNYYDRDMDGILTWMQFCIIALMVLALMAPLVIFIESKLLAVFGIVFFFGIFYMVDSFSNYIVSSAPKRMQEAEESAIENENGGVTDNGSEAEHQKQETSNRSSIFDETDAFRIESAVNEWINNGGYRQAGLKLPNAADAIDVPQYQLSAWLRQQGLTYASWMTTLRIDEAKRMLKKRPDWSNEAIAQHCGFSDRTYFQNVFRKHTGMTPAQYSELT